MINLELNKKERIAILKRAIELLETEQDDYMCTAIEIATYETIPGYGYDDSENSIIRFPELLKYKPVYVDSKQVWFIGIAGRYKRISILNEILKEIENE